MDENFPASMKALLAQWVTDRQHAFLEQVLLTWHEGMEGLAPNDALVERLVALMPAPEPAPAAEPAPPAPDTEADLGAGIDGLEKAGTQGEVLKQLLEALACFTERSALFVVKQGIASLYAHRGFVSETPLAATPVVPPQELEQLIQGQTALIQGQGPAYGALLAPLSRFKAADLRIVPLNLRHKTVALLLVDSGVCEAIEHPHRVRALAYVAEARLAHLAGAKEAKERKEAAVEAHPSVLTQLIPDPIQENTGSTLDPKVRINAERSARVLVGDLELYFPAKVTQGQQQGNMYLAMRNELDRSRHSFVERYGAELEDQHRIFYQTVIQQLCGGDPSRLGQAPWASH